MSKLTVEQEQSRADAIGRVDEVRADISRNYEAYARAADSAASRLNAMAGSPDAEVRKAVSDLAAEYDLDVSKRGLKQPATPKRHSPFAD